MARADYPHVRSLVAVVMDRLGVSNARQLSNALGMTDIDRERRALRWVKGENAPSFDYTMLMLSKAGLLAAEADAAWREKRPASAEEEAALAAQAAREALESAQTPRDEEATARRGQENV